MDRVWIQMRTSCVRIDSYRLRMTTTTPRDRIITARGLGKTFTV